MLSDTMCERVGAVIAAEECRSMGQAVKRGHLIPRLTKPDFSLDRHKIWSNMYVIMAKSCPLTEKETGM